MDPHKGKDEPETDFNAALIQLNNRIIAYGLLTDPEVSTLTAEEVDEETDTLLHELNKFYNAMPSKERNKGFIYATINPTSDKLRNYQTIFNEIQQRKRLNIERNTRELIMDPNQNIDDIVKNLLDEHDETFLTGDLRDNLPANEPEDDSYFTQFFRKMGTIKNHQFTGPYTKLFKKIRENVDPHSPLDALSMTHDIDFSLVKNAQEEQEADEKYIKRVDRLLRNISMRNFGGKYDTMIANINTVKRAFSWKKSSGINFLTTEQYRENEMRPKHVEDNLKAMREQVFFLADKGKLKNMNMKDLTKKIKFRDPDKDFIKTETIKTGVYELDEDSSDPDFRGRRDPDTDIDESSVLDTEYDPVEAARAREREQRRRGREQGRRDPFIHTSLKRGDMFNPYTMPKGDASDSEENVDDDPTSGFRPRRPRPRVLPSSSQPQPQEEIQADPAMENVFNQREREKRIFLNNEALADDPESVHWLRPSFLKRYKQLQELKFYASQEHKEVEDYNDELIFNKHNGFGERTERTSKGLNMVDKMAERDYCLRFNIDPNAPFYKNKRFISKRDAHVTFGKGEKYNYPFINKNYPLYTLPRDYSPSYELLNNSRINEGISYDEYINSGLGHLYGSKKYDTYCNKMKKYPEPMKYHHTNYMDAPLKNQIDQTPQFPFNRKIFDKVEPIRTQGGDIPATIKCDEDINRVDINIKDKTPEFNQWTDEYANHYNRMYTKNRYNTLYFK